jgi:hypothetical protein
MASTVILFDPTAPARPTNEEKRSVSALPSLAGKVVGFIDNAKPNFGLLADDIGALLESKLGVARVVKHRKPSASVPARPEVIEAFASECDVVITGSGD